MARTYDNGVARGMIAAARPASRSVLVTWVTVRQTALVGLAAMLLIVLRWPAATLHPAFRWEEAPAFWAATYSLDIWQQLTASWNGFLYLVPRLAFATARVVPIPPPIFSELVFAAGVGLVAAFVASDRLATAIPHRRALAAVGLALIPFDTYTSILQLHWFLVIYLALLPLATPHWSDRLGASVAALTGVGAIVTLPLYLWRRRDLLPFVGLGAAAQVASFALSSRRPPEGVDLAVSGMALVVRSLGSVIGIALPIAAIAVTAALVAGSLVALRNSLPRSTLVALAIPAAGIALAGVLSFTPDQALSSGYGARYFLVATWAIGLVALAGIRSRWAMLPLAALTFGIVTGFAQPALDGAAWEDQRCLGGPACWVPSDPAAWSFEWSPGYVPIGVNPTAPR